MLDGNLPTFYLKPASDGKKHHLNYILSQGGNEPAPAYSLQHPDPASPTSKNLYAAALFDSYNPEVLFGEVLLRPEWTQPSLSQEEIRKNGGVPPAPEPIMPKEFTIQLYNPDQQIVVRQKTTSWGSNPSYHFEVPQHTFRTPSKSVLDQQLSDPAADITTPKMNFAWRRDGRMTKDFTCYMTGKSTDPQGKHGKKGKDPDIVVAIFQALKEVTVYEPNLVRVEVEDPKGLEVVLLLGAAVIRDVFYGQLRDSFNIGETAPNGRRRKSSSPMETLQVVPNPPLSTSAPPGEYLNGAMPPSQKPQMQPPSRNDGRRQSFPPPNANAAHNIPPQPQSNRFYAQPQTQPPPPSMDPRSQWEIDAEAARLRTASDAEKRATEAARKEREKRDAAEQKRIKKMLEVEEKERRQKQAEVDKETERLRKKYGNQQSLAPPPALPQRHSAPNSGGSWYSGGRPVQQQAVPPRPVSHPRPAPQARPSPAQAQRPSGHGQGHSHLRPITIGSARPPQQPAPRPQHHGPYLAPHGGSRPTASVSSFFASNGLPLRPAAAPARPHPVPAPAPHGFVKQPKKGKSFFGLRSISENQASSSMGHARPAMPGAWPSSSGQGRLAKKKSSLW